MKDFPENICYLQQIATECVVNTHQSFRSSSCSAPLVPMYPSFLVVVHTRFYSRRLFNTSATSRHSPWAIAVAGVSVKIWLLHRWLASTSFLRHCPHHQSDCHYENNNDQGNIKKSNFLKQIEHFKANIGSTSFKCCVYNMANMLAFLTRQ